jgi:hypothetical protein
MRCRSACISAASAPRSRFAFPAPSPEQALQAVEREGAAERLRKIREEEERKAEEQRTSVTFNGYVYKTLGKHDPHSTQVISEYNNLYKLDPTWHICSPTPDALHVCAAYPWAAYALIFADGSVHCTAHGPQYDGCDCSYAPGQKIDDRGLRSEGGQYGIASCSLDGDGNPCDDPEFVWCATWTPLKGGYQDIDYASPEWVRDHSLDVLIARKL